MRGVVISVVREAVFVIGPVAYAVREKQDVGGVKTDVNDPIDVEEAMESSCSRRDI